MADKTYMLQKTAEDIDKIIQGAVVSNFAQELTPQEQAQAIENLGIDVNKLRFHINGYFDTFEELQTAIIAPTGGESYGVGTEAPYDVYTWDELRGRWVNNGPLRGQDGEDGKDGAAVNVSPAAPENPKVGDMWYDQNNDALKIFNGTEWVIANDFSLPPASVGLAELKPEVTAEALGGATPPVLLWENASPNSDFAAQTIPLDLSEYDLVYVYATQYGGGATGSAALSALALVGGGGILHYYLLGTESGYYAVFRQRSFIASATGITFENCLYVHNMNPATVTNNLLIPFRVYGIKGVAE